MSYYDNTESGDKILTTDSRRCPNCSSLEQEALRCAKILFPHKAILLESDNDEEDFNDDPGPWDSSEDDDERLDEDEL